MVMEAVTLDEAVGVTLVVAMGDVVVAAVREAEGSAAGNPSSPIPNRKGHTQRRRRRRRSLSQMHSCTYWRNLLLAEVAAAPVASVARTAAAATGTQSAV